MHFVIFHVFHLNGSEGAQTHVQKHRHDIHALCADSVHQLRREVQSGGRRGGGAFLFGVNGLIALLILQFFVDVGGEGHFAQLVQRGLHRAFAGEIHDAVAVLADLGDGGL